jgi:hypothetical protein
VFPVTIFLRSPSSSGNLSLKNLRALPADAILAQEPNFLAEPQPSLGLVVLAMFLPNGPKTPLPPDLNQATDAGYPSDIAKRAAANALRWHPRASSQRWLACTSRVIREFARCTTSCAVLRSTPAARGFVASDWRKLCYPIALPLIPARITAGRMIFLRHVSGDSGCLPSSRTDGKMKPSSPGYGDSFRHSWSISQPRDEGDRFAR